MADLRNIVNVSIIPSGKVLSRTNMNIVAIITSELGALSSLNRTKVYTDLGSVANDFGTNSKMYEFAKILFAQTKNPTNSGGYLVAGYWRAVDETVPAQSGKLIGAQIDESAVVKELQKISDGSFIVDIDGNKKTVTGLDFRTIDDLNDVASIIDSSIDGKADDGDTDIAVTVTVENSRLIIASDTTGSSSAVSFFRDAGEGSFVGNLLGLSDGTGAVTVAGEDEKVLAAETKEDALNEIVKEEAIRGAVFIDKPLDSEILGLATWAKSNDVILYDVLNSPLNLEKSIDNIAWNVVLEGGENYRMIYRKDGDRRVAVAYMSRMHTVNFNAENSAITMNLKELTGVLPEDYTQDEINKAMKVGLDLYTTFGDLPKLLVSGANNFVDNVYNFIAIKRFIQIDLFNLLSITGTKLAQIDSDVQKIVNTVEKTLKMFRKAKVIAPGKWTSPDTFGNVEVFMRNIETNGYYVLAQPLSEQSQDDREARKSPVIQVAFKNAGAIHHVDCIIQYNL